MHKSSLIKGSYRYLLTREWGEGLKRCCFIMLNPSTADSLKDDPTIRRCIAFSKAWNYDSLSVVNLFALRATRPTILKRHFDPVGPENNAYIINTTKQSEIVIAAWGAHGTIKDRSKEIRELIPNLMCLDKTNLGEPRHPLYLPKYLEPRKL